MENNFCKYFFPDLTISFILDHKKDLIFLFIKHLWQFSLMFW